MDSATTAKKIDRLDARTLLMAVVCACITSYLCNEWYLHLFFTSVMVLLMALAGFPKQAGIMLLLYIGIYILLVVTTTYGIVFPPPLMLSLIYRLIPPLIPAYLLFKMSTGKIILAFRSMHTPNSIMLTLTVMLRLMPTVRHEAADIKDAMRTRGFLGSFTDVIKNPLRTLEYAIVPLTFRLLKVADELSASAIPRGIQSPCKKESYYAGRITKIDIGIICVVITISIVLIML